jgi:S-adenosylhomocysteine hydrolase
MKKTYSLLALAGLVIALATPVMAADKEVTVTGEGKCGKCSLKETDKCQNVIQTEENGKKVTYYLEGKESKAFHENLCKESHKVTATGTVKEEDGKNVMHVAKIELAN